LTERNTKPSDVFSNGCIELLADLGMDWCDKEEILRALSHHPSALIAVRLRSSRICVQIAAGRILRVYESNPDCTSRLWLDPSFPLPSSIVGAVYPDDVAVLSANTLDAPSSKARRTLCAILGERRVARFFDPLLADLDAEWLEAVRAGDRRRARWALVKGYLELGFSITWYIVSAISTLRGLLK
jgi:hypothetical protein